MFFWCLLFASLSLARNTENTFKYIQKPPGRTCVDIGFVNSRNQNVATLFARDPPS